MTSEKVAATMIFTDGASSGNPGPGGWGAIILRPDGWVKELGGGAASTTNNRMEMTAAIESIETLNEAEPIEVYTDSLYLIKGITEWIENWQKNNWISTQGNPIANIDLWQDLAQTIAGRQIQWRHVRGHTGVPGNERADEIAVAFSRGEHPDLYESTLNAYPIALTDMVPTSEPKKAKKGSKNSKKPYSYLSLIQGELIRHDSWTDCENRIRGQSGARFKKAMTPEEEAQILAKWGVTPPKKV
jgi:ribonuclease HI